MNDLRSKYEHLELDLDGCYYHFKNRDVILYNHSNKWVNKVFERFQKRAKQYLYIIGNYIYFTINGVKYWYSLTSSEWEWYNINKLKKLLSIYAQDIVYVYGHLD